MRQAVYLSPLRFVFFLLSVYALVLNACKKDKIVVVKELEISGFSKSVGVASDLITIYGYGFQVIASDNSVSLGGKPMEVVDGSSNRLRVLVPEQAQSAKITITSGSRTVTSDSTFQVAILIEGTRAASESWTANRNYLLRGDVFFTPGTTLSIEAGTHIFGEKASHASLTLGVVNQQGFNVGSPSIISCSGTPERPVVFTSDQAPGRRSPGDWRGLRLNAQISGSEQSGNGSGATFRYVRIEYAGYYDVYSQKDNTIFIPPNLRIPAPSGDQGAAFSIVGLSDKFSIIDHIQVSYSAGDGFYLQDGSAGLKYAIAFRCAGNDFHFDGYSNNTLQFALGLKDPFLASSTGSDGILIGNTFSNLDTRLTPVTDGPVISNVTLVGGNASARNIPRQSFGRYLDSAVTNGAGRGIHIVQSKLQTQSIDHTAVFNSVIIGSWKAGASLDGPLVWQNYEGTNDQRTLFRHNVFSGGATQSLPELAGALGYESSSPGSSYFLPIPPSDVSKFAVFKQENIADNSNYRTNFYTGTARIKVCPDGSSDPNPSCPLTSTVLVFADNLSIRNLTDFSKITQPGILPGSDSPLISQQRTTQLRFGPPDNYSFGPIFSGVARIADVSFFESVPFIGAFGTSDWTSLWVSFDPNQQLY